MNPNDKRLVGVDRLPTTADIAPAQLKNPITSEILENPPAELNSRRIIAEDQLGAREKIWYNFRRRKEVVLVVLVLIFIGALSFAIASFNSGNKNNQSADLNKSNYANLNGIAGSIAANQQKATLQINYNTELTAGKTLTANGTVVVQNDSANGFKVQDASGNGLIVADTAAGRVGIGGAPTGSAKLQVNGNLSVNGQVVSGTGAYSLSSQGLSLNGVLVCTSAGCITQQNINGVATLAGNNSFTGVNKFTAAGNVFAGDGSGISAINAGNITTGTLSDNRLSNNVALSNGNNSFTGSNSFASLIQAGGGVDASAYSVNGTAGATFSCPAGELLQQPVIQGGIITGGNCVPGAGASVATLQQSYDASVPATVVLSTASGPLQLQDAATPLGTDLFEITNNGGATKYFEVSSAGAKVNGNDVCTAAGNCTGVSGGSIGGSGTANKLAKFTGSGFTIGDSILTDNGTTVSVAGTLNATTLQQAGTGVLLQTTAFGGDLSGTYNATSVDKLKGTALSINTLSSGQFLQYNGTNWVNQAISGDITVDNTGVAAIGAGKVTALQIADGTIANADISGTAGIDYGKLKLTGSIQDGDVSASSHFAFTNANQTFTGNNTFQLLGNPLTVEDASSPLGTNLFEVDDHTGATKYFTVSSTALQFNGNDVCTKAGNCVGTSAGIGGNGTAGKIAKFTGTGYTIGDSLISDNGSTVTVGGTLAVNTITPTATLTVGTPTQTLTLQGDASTSLSATSGSVTNSLVFAAPTVSNKTITIPDSTGTLVVTASGPLSIDAAGNISCPTCLTSGGGGTAGVTDVNGSSGSITLAGTASQIIITPSGGTYTFSTPQNIDTTSSVDFANVNVSGSLETNSKTRVDSSGNLTNINNVDIGGSLAAKAGTDFSTVGVSNDANFGNTSLIRLTGASAQTITGIANGRDGYHLTLINAGSASATLKNNDTTDSSAANVIITGIGNDLTLSSGASVNLVYDSGSSVWRVIGTSSAGGATATLQQSYDASTSSPQITLDSSPGANGLVIQDASSPITGNLFTVQSNGGSTKYLQVAATGITVSNLTSTGVITANGGISVAAGQSIVLNGSGTRPGSPAKGTLYFDTTTNQLISYNGTKWVSAPKSSTIIVAASNSTQAEKDAADYVATGTDDGSKINTALSALPAGGGSVYLMEGTYTMGATDIAVPNNVTLSGAGTATILKYANSVGSSNYHVIKNSDTVTGTNVTIENLLIDGNRTNQSAGQFWGIYFSGMGSASRAGGKISHVTAQNLRTVGIELISSVNNTITGNNTNGDGAYGIGVDSSSADNTVTGNTTDYNSGDGIMLGSSGNTITGNTASNNSATGIYLSSSSNNNTITGNTINTNTSGGIYAQSSTGNSIAGNTLIGNSGDGIYLSTSANSNGVVGNTISSNASYGIHLFTATGNILSSNKIDSNKGTTDNNGIYLESSSVKNSITGNDITDSSCTITCYAINISDAGSTGNYISANHMLGDGTHAASIHDATTGGNTYSNQPLSENGDASFRNATNSTTAFQIQNAAGTALFKVDTTGNGALTLAANVSATGKLDVTGSEATKKGTDYATTGLSVDTNFGDASLIRLTGASAQTIAGIANGRDGYRLTLINAGASSATLKNNDTTDETTAANLIITGTGSDLSLAAGASVDLVYDSGSSVWRVIGTSSAGGATATLQQSYDASTTSPQITLDSSPGAGGLVVQDNATPLVGSLFTVQSNSGSSKYLDVTSSGVTVSTLTSTGFITANGGISVAAGQSIVLNGSGTRPGSPSKGTLYFDTTTNQLLQYNGTKWMSDRSTATKIVAASNSTQAEKDAADYVATGTNDQATINTALTAAAGGTVYLMEGTYTLSASISVPDNTTLSGAGSGTVITIPNAQNGSYNMITNTDTTTGTNVTVRDLKLDGNRANQASGNMYGVYLNNMGSSSGRDGGKVTGVIANNFTGTGSGIYLINSFNNLIANNMGTGSAGYDFYLQTSSYNTVTGNIFRGSTTNGGAQFWGSTNNTLTGNTFQGNQTTGLWLSTNSNNNTVTGNTFTGNAGPGLELYGANNNTVSGNKMYDNGGATANNGVMLASSATKNSITGNDITDSSCSTTCYAINISDAGSIGNYLASNHLLGDGTHAASINDATSGGNTYSNQEKSENGDASFRNATDSATAFQIQNASGTSLFTVDTTGSGALTLAANVSATGKLDVAGSTATKKGADYATTGLSVDTNFGDASLIRLTGASAQTIAGIANGRDGYRLTLINAAGQAATLKNNDTTDETTAANLIITGTSADLSLAAGASVNLVYDSGSALWRVIGTSSAGGATATLQQSYDASTSSPQITLDSSPGAGGLIVQDNATPLVGSLFTVQSNGGSSKYLDVTSSGVTVSTLTSTGLITANGGISVAANQTIVLAGGTTGSRPASPTKGTLFYDTSTNQLISYNGTKWVSAPKSSTIIVAASNSSQAEKDAADYVATGTGDQATINSAFSALPAGGGSVYLMEGTYYISAAVSVPDNTTLEGAGASTIITIPNAQNGSYNMIQNTDTTTGTNVTIRGLLIDGNKANQSSGSMYGLYFNGMGGSNRTGSKINQITVQNMRTSAAVRLDSSNQNVISNNNISNNGNNGLYLNSSSDNTITGNIFNNNTSGGGIDLQSSTNNTISGNTANGNGDGLLAGNASNNVITGNTFSSNFYGIYADFSSGNNVSDNKLDSNGGATANQGIYLVGSSTKNSITGNDITDTSCTTTCYAINISLASDTGNYLASNHFLGDGTNPASINDATAGGNTYSNQPLTENGDASFRNGANSATAFQIQNAAGTSLFKVDTTGSGALTLAVNVSATGKLDVAGSEATKKGSDYATTGLSADVNFGDASLIRLTGASAQTIAGITNGRDGFRLTLINAAGQSATLKNNDTTDETTAANLIITGTGSDLSLAAGASVSLVYDSGSLVWRVIGTSSAGGATATLQQSYDASTSSPQITLDASPGANGLVIQDASSPITGNLFTVQNNGGSTKYLQVSATGVTVSNITSTGVITANGGISVAANQTITFAGGNTASRPGTPTDGTLYYDTSTHNLVKYNGTKWVSAPKSNTIIIAASNSSQAEKDAADYVASGTDDGATINTALSALPAGGGSVYLMEGTYTLGTTSINVPNNTTLTGSGSATVLKFANNVGSGTYYAIKNSDTTTGTNVTVKNLLIDGNKSNQSAGSFNGIYFNGMGSGTTRNGGVISGVSVQNIYGNGVAGITLYNSSQNTVSGNIGTGNGTGGNAYAIYLYSSTYNSITGNVTNNNECGIWFDSSSHNSVTGNTASNNINYGITLNNSSSYNAIASNTTNGQIEGIFIAAPTGTNNTVSGNVAISNHYGIEVDGSANTITGNTTNNSSFYGIYLNNAAKNTVTGNTSSNNSSYGIRLNGASGNEISGNKLDSNGATNNDAIYLQSSSTNNSITSNDITDSSCASTCYAINISDAGSTGNYFAANHFLGDGTHAASITNPNNDAETFANQPLSENGDASFRNATNSATAFQIQNAAGRDLLNANTSTSALQVGNTTDGSQISLAASGNANAVITKNMPVGGTVNAHDLVVIDSSTNGQVKTTTTANDTKVFGIATGSGTPQDIVISGTYQVNLLPTNQAISPGDYLVSTTTAGDVDKASGVPPSGTAIGEALEAKAANAGGTIWVYVTPGAGGTGSGSSTTLQQAYDYSTSSPQITLDASPGANGLVIQDASSPITGNLFTVQSNGGSTKYLQVAATGITVSNLTSTGVITANGGISVAAGQSIVLNGSGTRPGSPTKGTLYYDTTTNQLISYNGTKWQAPSKSNTFIVAASNSTQAEKDAADYVATGTGDQATINSALSALPAGGGSVYLMEGTYTISAAISVPNNTILSGAGAATIITIPNAQNGSYNMITNTDTATGTNVTIQNLLIDGNKANQSALSMKGISLTGVGLGSTRGARIINTVIQNIYSGPGIYINSSNFVTMAQDTVVNNGTYGINLNGANFNNMTGNVVYGNNTAGIYLNTTSNDNTVAGNTVQSNGNYGVIVQSSSYNVVNSNVVQSNFYGISLVSSTSNTVTGNNVYNNGGNGSNEGIYLTLSSNNSLTSNTITDSSCTTNCYAIDISNSGSSKNYLSNNYYTGSASNAASINDSGTATIYANQQTNSTNGTNSDVTDFRVRGSANSTTAFQIQNASGNSLLSVNTSTPTISLGSGAVSANIDITGSEATKKGSDYATTGLSVDTNFGNTSLVRLTGASTQTIAGIANGRDGYRLTLINAAGQAAILKNNDTTDETTAANLIITGTGADLSLAAGASVNLVYDSGSALWRVIGTSSAGGATATLQQAYTAGTGGSTPEIIADNTRGGVDIQDRSTTNGGTLGGSLLTVRGTAANDTTQGSALFNVQSTGTATFSPTGNVASVVVKQTSYGSPTADIMDVQNAAGTLNYLSFNLASGVPTLKVYDSTGTNYASISYSGGAAIFAASSGVTQIGSSAGGPINFVLANDSDYLKIDHTTSLSASIGTSYSDVLINRSLTQGSFNSTGSSVLKVQDNSSTSGGIIAPDVVVINQNNGSATGNVLNVQTGGTSIFSVANAGNVSAANSISIGAGKSYTGSGAVTVASAASSALTLTGNASSTWSTASGTLTVQGASGLTIGTSSAGAINIGPTNATSIVIGGNAAATLTEKVANSSATAYQLQTAGGTSLISVNTTSSVIQIGNATTDGTAYVLGLDSYNESAGTPTVANGGMYFDSVTGSFRCGENGAWFGCAGGLVTSSTATSNALTLSTSDQSFTGGTNNSYTVLANDCQAGVVYNIIASGTWTATSTTPAVTLYLDEDGTATHLLTTGTSVKLGTASTTAGWQLNAQMICDSTTAAEIQGTVLIGTNGSGAATVETLTNTGTKTWSASNHVLTIGMMTSSTTGAPSATMRQFIVQRMAP